jgi:cytochrome P450
MEAACRRYGDVVTFRRPFAAPWVLVFHPDAVEQIFRAPADRLTKDKQRAPRLAPVIGERSLALREGDDYMRYRRLIRPGLHGESLREYEGWVREAADQMIDSWPVGTPFSLLPWMTSLTVDMTIRAVLGIDDRRRREEVAAQLQELTDPDLTLRGRVANAVTRGRVRSGNAGDAKKQRRVVDQLLREVIAERRLAPDLNDRSDILSALLTARDDHGEEMSDQEVFDHAVTLLVGGRINPSATLAWAFDLLLRNPTALSRLREELAAGDESYLEAVVRETLRIRSVDLTPVGRVVHEQSFALGDHLIPPETHVSVGAAVIHRRADIHPDPDVFRPERFLGSRRAYIYTWLPFGGGTRRCPGADFSMMEVAGVIRRVLERAHLAPVGRRPESSVPKAAALRKVITRVPAHGTRVIQLRPPDPVATDAAATVGV